ERRPAVHFHDGEVAFMTIDDEAVGFRHGRDLLRLSVAASSAVQKVAHSVRPPQFTAHYARAPRAARRGAELRRSRPPRPAPPAVPLSRYRPPRHRRHPPRAPALPWS